MNTALPPLRLILALACSLSVLGIAQTLEAQNTNADPQAYTIQKLPSTTNPTDSFTVKVYEEPAQYSTIQTKKFLARVGMPAGWS